MSVRERLLGSNAGYTGFLRLIRADRFLQVVADDALCVPSGGRLLDLGCGNGALCEHVPGIDYTGIDHNRSYIDNAARRHAGAGRRFICADLDELAVIERGTFDVVYAIGVLHHLDDELAVAVISTGLQLLASAGRFVSVDPVFHPAQRSIARVLMALDRGKFVRHPEHYRSLAAAAGASWSDHLRFDLNPFPYTHLLMELTPSASPAPVVS